MMEKTDASSEGYEEIPNFKSQISNKSQWPKFKFPNWYMIIP